MGLFEKKEENVEVVEVSAKVYSEKNKAIREKQQEQAKALVRICEWATANNCTAIIEDLKILRPSFFGIGGLPSGVKNPNLYIDKLLALLNKDKFEDLAIGLQFTSVRLFEKFGYGTSEATIFIRELVKSAPDVSKRIWVVRKMLDSGIVYEICGIGEDRPAEFAGKFAY